ncbi:hypothetical protein BDP27DRAFT_1432785 [Rhodocollybia butyracea]|uniref:Uncharacterized protein n=1 Tax=Rhodocollybia butyracea TaxID=206335 RepID=A0A9P5P8Z2_9AGAR|nr:hypothetical protein BDP27DRAFT_1432785 [Rhodocollybia butyracea]
MSGGVALGWLGTQCRHISVFRTSLEPPRKLSEAVGCCNAGGVIFQDGDGGVKLVSMALSGTAYQIMGSHVVIFKVASPDHGSQINAGASSGLVERIVDLISIVLTSPEPPRNFSKALGTPGNTVDFGGVVLVVLARSEQFVLEFLEISIDETGFGIKGSTCLVASAELSFEASGLFESVPDEEATHNDLSLIGITFDSQSPWSSPSRHSLASSLSRLLSPSTHIVHSTLPFNPNLDRTDVLKEMWSRFEKYFEDHPEAKTWILESPSASRSTSAKLSGVDISSHSTYSWKGYQGPSMFVKAVSYVSECDSEISDTELDVMKQMVYKMETRRTAKEKNAEISKKSPPPSSKPQANRDPEPSKPVPPIPSGPVKPPKPIIGKIPPNYVPPQECSIGNPKEETRNYRFRSPIETDEAVERIIQAGLSGTVTVRQDDLLAAAPEYRRKVKDSVTGRRVGIDGSLLEDLSETFMAFEDFPTFCPSVTKDCIPHPLMKSAFFNDYPGANEGDGYYVAKESLSICSLNALIGDRSVHCVVDSGCSIVAMSDTACNVLGLTFDPGKIIPLERKRSNRLYLGNS